MKRWRIILNMVIEVLVFLACTMALLFAVPKLLGFFWPFVASWILAMLASPLCSFLEKHIRLTKKWASAVIIIVVLLLIAGICYCLITMIGKEMILLLSDIPKYYNSFKTMISDLGAELNRLVAPVAPDFGEQIETISEEIIKQAGTFVNRIAPESVKIMGSAAANLTSGLIGTMVMILSAYFFIADREKLSESVVRILPEDVYRKISDIKERLVAALEGFFIAQFKIMGIIFVILLIGFIILRNPYALLLALLISFLDLLPVIGTGTILIPWAVLSLLQRDFRQGIFLLILYVICLLGRQLLQPKIIGDSVGLDTLPTLVLIYTGYKLSGMKGIILALLVGIVFITFYRLGLFDKKISRLNRLWDQYQHYDQDTAPPS